MDANDVKQIVATIRNETKKLKDKVQTNIQVTRPHTNKTISSKISFPYDASLDDIRDTLENDESFTDVIESGMGRYPPLKLVPRFPNRHDAEMGFNHQRMVPGYVGTSNDHLPDEYSFYIPPTQNDGGIVSMKTAEFEGLVRDDTEPDFASYPKSKPKPRKSPQGVSQRDSVRDNEDVKNMKHIIEALSYDNQVLQQDNEDFKKALQLVFDRYKEVQRELENEKKKSAKIEILEQQLRQEKLKNAYLSERNTLLSDKCVKFVDFLQHLSTSEEKFTEEEEELFAQISTENAHLRQLLGIARVSDPKFMEIEQYLIDKTNEIEESKQDTFLKVPERGTNGEFRITQGALADFRKEREMMFSMRRTLSVYSEKSDKATPKIGSVSTTENALEAASNTPSSNHSWDQIRSVNTNESFESAKGIDMSIERNGSDKKI